MSKQKQNFDQLGYLVRRLIRLVWLIVVPYGFIFLVVFSLIDLLFGVAPSWQTMFEIFTLFGLGFFGCAGLCTTLFWLVGGYRFAHFRQLQARRRAAQKRRAPCRLSLELGFAELDEKVKSQPPSEYRSRMRDFLAAVKSNKIRKPVANLWEADGLRIGFNPPKPASFFRTLLERIKLALQKR